MKRIPLLLLSLLATLFVLADNVSEQQAYSIAVDFAKSHNINVKAQQPKMAAKRLLAPDVKTKAAAYYVFNMGGKDDGFVIVSGDDRAEPVFGYSDTGSYDASNVPDGLRWMLDTYAKSVESLGNSAKAAKMSKEKRPAIPYLIKTKWGQGAPYNLLCPIKGGSRCVTGCVATALSQILYYWRTPAEMTKEIPAYDSYEALPPTSFDWNKIQLTYNYEDSSENAMEVAKLMEYCGHAVKMDYQTDGSGAVLYTRVFSQFFGFAPAKMLERSQTLTADWERVIYNELKAGRPVCYGGRPLSDGAGHEFICDGYDGDGYFHINWGWSGGADGYFSLSALTPDDGSEGDDYSYRQSITYNIMPAELNHTDFGPLTVYKDITLSNGKTDSTVMRTSTDADFSYIPDVHVDFINQESDTASYNVGIALYKEDSLIGLIRTVDDSIYLPPYYYSENTLSIASDLFKNLDNGVYRIVPVSKYVDERNYLPCANSDVKYVEATINGNTMTLRVKANTEFTRQNAKFSISNFSIEGKLKQYRTVKAKFKLTNMGTGGSLEPIYVYLGSSHTTAMATYCDPGDTVDITIPIQLTDAGKLQLLLKDDSATLYKDIITVSEAVYTELKGTMTQEAPIKTAQGKADFGFSLQIVNNGPADYDDEILVYLRDSTAMQNSFAIDVKVPANDTITVPVKFENIDINDMNYYANVSYYHGSETKYLSHTRFKPQSPFLEIEEQNFGDLAIMPEKISGTIVNNGLADYDGTIVAYIQKWEEEKQYWLTYTYDTLSVNIPEGGSYTVTYNPNLYELSDSGKYVVCVRYKSGNPDYAEWYHDKILEMATFNKLASQEQDIKVTCLGDRYRIGKTVTYKYVNNGQNDYHNYVFLRMWYHSKEKIGSVLACSKWKLVTIPAGDSISVDYDISSLNKHGEYWGGTYYVSKEMKRAAYLDFETAEMSGLEVFGFTIDGIAKKGRRCTLTFNVRNSLPKDYYFPYLLCVNDSALQYSSENVDSCGTSSVEIPFTLKTSGQIPVVLLNGNTWFADTLYSTVMDVEGLPNLEVTEKELGDLTIVPDSMSATINNTGSADYDGKIVASVFKWYESWQGWNIYNRDTISVNIPAGGSYILNYKIDPYELSDSGKYVVRLYYMSGNYDYERYDKSIDLATFTKVTGPEQDIKATLIGDSYEIGKTVTYKYVNQGSNDYHNYVFLRLWHQSKEKGWSEMAYSKWKLVTIPAGDSITVDYDISSLNKHGEYWGGTYYVSKEMKRAAYLDFETAEMSGLEVSGFTIDGVAKEGRRCTLTFNVRNCLPKGYYFPYLLCVNDSALRYYSVYLDSCGTRSVEIPFTLKASGQIPVVLLNGNTWFADTLYSTVLEVGKPAAADLYGYFVLKSMKSDHDGNAITFDINVTNTLDTEFDDAIYLSLKDKWQTGIGYKVDIDTIVMVTIKPHETVVLPFSFSGLAESEYYYVSSNYYDTSSWRYICSGYFYTTMGVLTTRQRDLGTVTEIPENIEITLTNSGLGDYNDAIEVNVYKWNDTRWDYYGSFTDTVSIATGEERIVNVNLSSKWHRWDDGEYKLEVSYAAPGYSWCNLHSGVATTFHLSKPNAIDNVKADNEKKVRVYDLSGRYIGTMAKTELKTRLKKGLYIIGGKKMVVK